MTYWYMSKILRIVPNKLSNGEKKIQPSTVNKTKVIRKKPTGVICFLDACRRRKKDS